MWQPIETAPKDNKHPLWLARFNDDGTMQSFDYNGSWERESAPWEIPRVYYFWASETGNVEEPSHWAYQPEGFCDLPGAQPAPIIPKAIMEVIAGLVYEIERNICTHEETHRGGQWEICDMCGAKWADDRGGKPEFKWPEVVEKARDMLATAPESKP